MSRPSRLARRLPLPLLAGVVLLLPIALLAAEPVEEPGEGPERTTVVDEVGSLEVRVSRGASSAEPLLILRIDPVGQSDTLHQGSESRACGSKFKDEGGTSDLANNCAGAPTNCN